MFINLCENLFIIVEIMIEYIIVIIKRLFIIFICGAFKKDSENISTATAIPFGIFNVMYMISFSVYFCFLSVIFIAINLVIISVANIISDFIINGIVMFISITNPRSINTSISSEFESIPLNACSDSFFDM